jgi:hypothetical protein
MSRGTRSLLAAGLLLVPIVAACASPQPVPSVVGSRLDQAHNTLTDAGFEKFVDHDVVSDRGIWLDHNWVVVSMDPAGTSLESSTQISLGVVKADLGELAARLPADAPAVRELQAQVDAQAADAAQRDEGEKRKAERQAAEKKQRAAAEAAEAAAERRAAVDEYIEVVDSQVRSTRKVLGILDRSAESVSGGGDSVTAAGNAIAAKDFFDTAGRFYLIKKPGRKADMPALADRLGGAMGHLSAATEALLSAVDYPSPSSVARWRQERSTGIAQWNAGVKQLYQAAAKKAPVYKQT